MRRPGVAGVNGDTERLRILLVDDDAQRHEGVRAEISGVADLIVRDPSDVGWDDLENVDLVSVDEYLGAQWESERAESGDTLALANQDGLAVAAAFQSIRRANGAGFGVTLHTAELERLGGDLPARFREPLTAMQHDLDWVLDFASSNFGSRLVAIARASRSLARHAKELPLDSGWRWLNAPDAEWAELALEQIQDCRPPAHALVYYSGGHSYLRWLAQRILPYPTFLLDSEHSATLLGLELDSWRELAKSEVANRYKLEYAGPLRHLLGPRWWRAGLLQLLVDAASSPWETADERVECLSRYTSIDLVPMKAENPVVGYDADGNVVHIGLDAGDAVRLLADGWPVYADDPWARVGDVLGSEALRHLLALSDRRRLEEIAGAGT